MSALRKTLLHRRGSQVSQAKEVRGGVQTVISALYVEIDGCYYGLPDVDPWDKQRDARLYAGPWPVVAHPPCERWGRYWGGGPNVRVKRVKGDDGGCFASALASVRAWGGVLEHPCDSAAWLAHELRRPPRTGGWFAADFQGGWCCCVCQGHYGHPAQKATWLYAHGCELPSLRWGPCSGKVRLEEGFSSTAERRALRAQGVPPIKRLSTSERMDTPTEFRDLLLGMARTVKTDKAQDVPVVKGEP
jgi:hypothetical protein